MGKVLVKKAKGGNWALVDNHALYEAEAGWLQSIRHCLGPFARVCGVGS